MGIDTPIDTDTDTDTDLGAAGDLAHEVKGLGLMV